MTIVNGDVALSGEFSASADSSDDLLSYVAVPMIVIAAAVLFIVAIKNTVKNLLPNNSILQNI